MTGRDDGSCTRLSVERVMRINLALHVFRKLSEDHHMLIL